MCTSVQPVLWSEISEILHSQAIDKYLPGFGNAASYALLAYSCTKNYHHRFCGTSWQKVVMQTLEGAAEWSSSLCSGAELCELQTWLSSIRHPLANIMVNVFCKSYACSSGIQLSAANGDHTYNQFLFCKMIQNVPPWPIGQTQSKLSPQSFRREVMAIQSISDLITLIESYIIG